MQGRYGPYVSDGVTNASLPCGVTVEEVTFEYALNLLKEERRAGPSKRAARKKAAPKAAKKPAKKKAASKKTAGKKAVRKKKAARGILRVSNRMGSRRKRSIDSRAVPRYNSGVRFPPMQRA